MRAYRSESDVIAVINEAITAAGGTANARYYKDDQSPNSATRTAVFRAAISAGSENVVNKIADMGARGEIDRGITYRGGQAEPTDGGEVRYLFFEAKINPYEEE